MMHSCLHALLLIIFYIGIYGRAGLATKGSCFAIRILLWCLLVSWVIYNQNSTGLTIWADQYAHDIAMPHALWDMFWWKLSGVVR